MSGNLILVLVISCSIVNGQI